jgi:hypothetical protein
MASPPQQKRRHWRIDTKAQRQSATVAAAR